MTTLTWQRHTGHASSYDVVAPGFNYRLDELRSRLALVQLERLPAANAARQVHVRRYRELLDGVSRDGVRAHLQGERIQTSVHYPPIHGFTYYSASGQRSLPRTDEVAGRILTLPLYPHMRDDDVVLVADTLAQAVRAEQAAA